MDLLHPMAFQTVAYVLELRASEIIHVLFNSGILVFYCPLALLGISPVGFERSILWVLICPVQVPLDEELIGGSDPLFLWEGFYGFDLSPVCGFQ